MGLFDFIARTGRGIGSAGRDVVGQMIGSTGPNDASTLAGRFGNVVANEMNPIGGVAQTAGAFADGFRGQSGTDPGRFAGATEAISNDAASSRPGSVVGRGFIGRQDRGPVTGGAGGVRGGQRFAAGGLLNQNTFGTQTQGRNPNFRMPGTGGTAEQMPVDEYTATMPQVERPGAGGRGNQGRSTAHVTGGDVSLSEHIARQRPRADFER